MPIHDWTRVSAGTWHDFHLAWIAELRRALNTGLLPPGYYALAEQVAGDAVPDVLTLAGADPNAWPGGNGTSHADGGSLALAAAPPRATVVEELDDDRAAYAARQRRVAIHREGGDRVVALVELVSLANKDRAASVAAFVDKLAAALCEGVHLLIVDLFPQTARDPTGLHDTLWRDLGGRGLDRSPAKPLSVAAYRAARRAQRFVEPLAVGDALPDFPLFLTPERYVNVPLDATYAATWSATPVPVRRQLAGAA